MKLLEPLHSEMKELLNPIYLPTVSDLSLASYSCLFGSSVSLNATNTSTRSRFVDLQTVNRHTNFVVTELETVIGIKLVLQH